MSRIYLALGILGAGLSLYFSIKLCSVLLASGAMAGYVAAVLLQGCLYAYMYGFAQHVIRSKMLTGIGVLLIATLSIGASFFYMQHELNTRLAQATADHQEAQQHAKDKALSSDTGRKLAQDALDTAVDSIRHIDRAILVAQGIVEADSKANYRTRATAGADGLQELRQERVAALRVVDDRRRALVTVLASVSATVTVTATPMMQHVNEAARTAVLLLLAVLIDGVTLLNLSLAKREPVATPDRQKMPQPIRSKPVPKASWETQAVEAVPEPVKSFSKPSMDQVLQTVLEHAQGAKLSVRGIATALDVDHRKIAKRFIELETEGIIIKEGNRWKRTA